MLRERGPTRLQLSHWLQDLFNPCTIFWAAFWAAFFELLRSRRKFYYVASYGLTVVLLPLLVLLEMLDDRRRLRPVYYTDAAIHYEEIGSILHRRLFFILYALVDRLERRLDELPGYAYMTAMDQMWLTLSLFATKPHYAEMDLR